MTGRELLGNYLSKRDHSGSPEDEYALLLGNIAFTCPDFDLLTALEKAEKEGKTIQVSYPAEVLNGDILVSEIQAGWITIS